jgi:hypothetical protein
MEIGSFRLKVSVTKWVKPNVASHVLAAVWQLSCDMGVLCLLLLVLCGSGRGVCPLQASESVCAGLRRDTSGFAVYVWSGRALQCHSRLASSPSRAPLAAYALKVLSASPILINRLFIVGVLGAAFKFVLNGPAKAQKRRIFPSRSTVIS